MTRFSVAARWVLLMLTACLLPGCGQSVPPALPKAPTSVVTAIEVRGRQLPLFVGETAQLTATAIVSTERPVPMTVTARAAWVSSDASIASVSPVGLVTAKRPGTAEIRATFGDQTGTFVVVVVAAPASLPPALGLACGVERWSVKTLSDASAATLDLSRAVTTTVRALNERPSHCGGGLDIRTFDEEFQQFEVIARIRLVRFEEDRDYHIVLTDPSDGAYSVIAEVVDARCRGAASSVHVGVLTAARQAFERLMRAQPTVIGLLVRVRGIGFFDPNHGQTGRSRNCIELHPVLSIEPVGPMAR